MTEPTNFTSPDPPPSPQPSKRRRALDEEGLYQILIECRDEAEQRELYESLTKAGHHVRLMVL